MSKYKLIINLKTYKESTGKKAIKIAKICKELEKEAKKRSVEIILCPQVTDIKDIKQLKVNSYAQHIDNIEYGANTGYILPEAIKDAGAIGTLISHSEHQLPLKEIEARIKKAKSIGLKTCVCARDDKRAKEVSKFKPDFIAVEPKEFIGTDISISTAKPQLIEKSVKAVGKITLLVGAGVKTTQDVKKAVELGSYGILVASGVVKVKNIRKAILELIQGFD